MNSPRAVKDRICPACERRLNETSDAMRRHASRMSNAIHVMKSNPPEQRRLELKDEVTASFIEAQAAWDAYRDHLVEHGFLPAPEKS